MSQPLIELKELTKYFDISKTAKLHAVDGITLNINKGETLGVVGESGCGKSTLGRTVLRLHEPTSGTILFDGEDISHCRAHKLTKVRRDMQMIFQDPYSSLNPRMSVQELIAEPLLVAGQHKNKADIYEDVARLMDTVGLASRLSGAYPHELDGGRRQRIGVARALALNPRFIVCDEPVSALDVSIQAQILNLLMDLQEERGLTYMFITHNLSVVKHISHDILVMYLGCEVEKCESEELFLRPLHPYTKGLLSAIPIPSIHVDRKRIVMSGEVTSPINPKPGCRFAARCPYATEKCTQELPQVEEVLPNHFCACHHVRELNNL